MSTPPHPPPGDPSERVLLEHLWSGDRDAFDALFDRYFARVWRVASRSSVDPQARAEVTRDVMRRFFGTLVRGRGRGDGRGPGPAALGLALTLLELERRGLPTPAGAKPPGAPAPDGYGTAEPHRGLQPALRRDG